MKKTGIGGRVMFWTLFIVSWLFIFGGIGGGVYNYYHTSNPDIWMWLIVLTAFGGMIRYYAGKASYN